jgi:hypothetical protein
LGGKPKVGAGLNASEVLRGANLGGEKSTKAQGQAQKPLFGQLANQQLSQIDRIARQLNNPYTRAARGQVNRSLRDAGRGEQVANATIRDAATSGRKIANLAPLAQRQANQAGQGITRLGNQVVNVGDAAGRAVNQLAPGAVNIGNQFMGQMSGLGSMLANQARRGFASGPTALENQIARAGIGAMSASANQVTGPGDMRVLDPGMARAANAGFVAGPNAATARAANANFVAGPNAATARRVEQISQGATDVQAGGLGRALLQDATGRLQSAGRLSAQDERDVAQSTRASFAARGLATSAPAAMTEALNRDRFSRQRMAEDRAYAQDVQAGNIGRQQDNSQRQLAAIQGNQQVGSAMSLADQQALNQMRSLGYEGSIEQRQFNAGNQQQTNLANQQALNQMRSLGYEGSIDQRQFNAGNQQQTNLANQQALNQMRSLGYEGSIDQRQFNAGNQQQTNLANQASRNQIGMSNQQRDEAMARMGMDAQRFNQEANMQQLANNRGFMLDANTAFNRGGLDRAMLSGDLAASAGAALNMAGQTGMAGRELAGDLYDAGGRLRMTGRELGGSLLDAGGRLRLLGTQTAGDLRATGADTSMRGRQIGGTLLNQMGALRQDGARTLADLDPYQRAIQGGLSLGQTAQMGALDTVQAGFGNMLDLFANTGSFNVNRNDSFLNSWLNNATAVKTGNQAASAQTNAANITAAATRAARPKWWETTLGAVGNIFSDERMKTDVKPIGTAGNVLGLTAYEFRYKGDKKKHKGFMAQDVQKVLPEAVEEVDYKGKKRLTIKPMVIGAALAEELMSAKAA